MKKILILGAGFGGLETATGLSEAMRDGYEITLVDKNDAFFVGFTKIDGCSAGAAPPGPGMIPKVFNTPEPARQLHERASRSSP